MIWLQAAVLALAASSPGETVLLDFTADWCVYCRQMDPTLQRLAARGYPIRKVDVQRDRALAERYAVRELPCYVMLAGGQEVDRVVGATSFGRLEQMFKRATGDRPPPAALPAKPTLSRSRGTEISLIASGPIGSGGAAQAVGPLATVGGGVEGGGGAAPGWKSAAPGWSARTGEKAARAGKKSVSDAELIASTVRLRIEDPDGHSCGTGTIVDARQGWALALTCGHIFRDSHGKGRIEIDLFGPTRAERIPGEIVSYDLKLDVGLVRFRTPGPVAAARVAPVGYKITNGDRAVSLGCNNGGEPTTEHSRVCSQNKFLGPPNLQAGGLPVVGRSGGGLFSSDGFLIGVCNAADPKDNEGLFAALPSIHAELDRAGLSFVHKSPPADQAPYDSPNIAPRAALVRVDPPSMPKQMPSRVRTGSPGEDPLLPTAARSAPDRINRPEPLRREEMAMLEEIERHGAGGYEVICIIRSKTDPRAKSKIFVLEDTSPTMLRCLAGQGQADDVR